MPILLWLDYLLARNTNRLWSSSTMSHLCGLGEKRRSVTASFWFHLYIHWFSVTLGIVKNRCEADGNWSYRPNSLAQFCRQYGHCHLRDCLAVYSRPKKTTVDESEGAAANATAQLVPVRRNSVGLSNSSSLCSSTSVYSQVLSPKWPFGQYGRHSVSRNHLRVFQVRKVIGSLTHLYDLVIGPCTVLEISSTSRYCQHFSVEPYWV